MRTGTDAGDAGADAETDVDAGFLTEPGRSWPVNGDPSALKG